VPEDHVIMEEPRAVIARLLLERISLRGICRAMGVGLQGLLQFMVERFQAAPEHPHVKQSGGTPALILPRREAELAELWSLVGKTANRHWVWSAMDATTRPVLAFHVGDRRGQSAQALWEKIPAVYREHAVFYTDHYAAYTGVLPAAQHRAISKLARMTNHVERFNCTLRQRVSRLVRSTPSFSKKLTNHIGAIKYFICHSNLTRCAALPE
jgi:IS1 family transposase